MIFAACRQAHGTSVVPVTKATVGVAVPVGETVTGPCDHLSLLNEFDIGDTSGFIEKGYTGCSISFCEVRICLLEAWNERCRHVSAQALAFVEIDFGLEILLSVLCLIARVRSCTRHVYRDNKLQD